MLALRKNMYEKSGFKKNKYSNERTTNGGLIGVQCHNSSKEFQNTTSYCVRMYVIAKLVWHWISPLLNVIEVWKGVKKTFMAYISPFRFKVISKWRNKSITYRTASCLLIQWCLRNCSQIWILIVEGEMQ